MTKLPRISCRAKQSFRALREFISFDKRQKKRTKEKRFLASAQAWLVIRPGSFRLGIHASVENLRVWFDREGGVGKQGKDRFNLFVRETSCDTAPPNSLSPPYRPQVSFF